MSSPKVKYVKTLSKTKGKNWLDLDVGSFYQEGGIRFNPGGFDLNERDTLLAKKRNLKYMKKDMTGFCEIAKKENIKIDVASATGYFDMVANPNKEIALLKNIMRKGAIIMIDLLIILFVTK